MAAAHISMAFNCQGPNNTVVTACVAGTQAVGEAFRLVARGDADVMLCGGADSRIDPLMLLAYTALGTLSKRADLARRRSGRGRSTGSATGSSSAKGRRCWCWRSTSGRRPGTRRSTPR